MADLPVDFCKAIEPPSGYRAMYVCVSNFNSAGTYADDGYRGNVWEARVKVSDKLGFDRMSFNVVIPDRLLARLFRHESTWALDGMRKSNPRKQKRFSDFQFQFLGPLASDVCPTSPNSCTIGNALKVTVRYK